VREAARDDIDANPVLLGRIEAIAVGIERNGRDPEVGRLRECGAGAEQQTACQSRLEVGSPAMPGLSSISLSGMHLKSAP
jgi:hypothetical protein